MIPGQLLSITTEIFFFKNYAENETGRIRENSSRSLFKKKLGMR